MSRKLSEVIKTKDDGEQLPYGRARVSGPLARLMGVDRGYKVGFGFPTAAPPPTPPSPPPSGTYYILAETGDILNTEGNDKLRTETP